MRLDKKVTIITGAGSGIGRAAALLFAREGARVLLVDIDAAKAQTVAAEIGRQGGTGQAFPGDVSTEESAQGMVARAIELWGRLDILVNNAASFHWKRVEEATRADWDKVWSVNVVGTSLCSKHALEVMKKQRSGSIVNVGSINGLVAMPEQMSYNATKAAIIEMSKSMAVDLGPFNIRVNCVCPGITHTPAVDRLLVEMGVTLEEAEKTYAAPRCIIKRFGKPEEMAAAILFVASDEASYMTGATLVVDGGFTA